MARQIAVEAPILKEQRLPMTYEEYRAWTPEGVRAEWVAGEVIVFMPPLTRHNRVLVFLVALLRGYLDLFDLGEVFAEQLGMDLPSRPSVRLPDVLVVRREHADRLTREGLVGPADLVVELVSEDSVARDRVEKFREYEAAGVPEYLLVDAREGREDVALHRLNAEGRYEAVEPDAAGRYHSAVLPGFWIDPRWLWQDPLPRVLDLIAQIAPVAMLLKLETLLRAHDQPTRDS